ncbi:hypothetical protein [Shewanella sp. ANA-3]|uniref:hypothetical protein n=1 Tax=Shewanella sp. (strain ANA-3) TaxID=94122 RepID=UPI0002DA98C6|nr:hypothetical protein [Shewanella sp. ANA-3]
MWFTTIKGFFNSHKVVTFIAIISLVVSILIDVIFSSSPELFDKGDEVSKLISNSALTFFNGYVFYMVIACLKNYDDLLFKKTYSDRIMKMIMENSKSFFNILSNHKIKFSIPSDEYLESFLVSFSIYDDVAMQTSDIRDVRTAKNLNAYEFLFNIYPARIHEFINTSQYFLSYIDPRIGVSVIELYNCELFKMLTNSDQTTKLIFKYNKEQPAYFIFKRMLQDYRNCVSKISSEYTSIYGTLR